MAVWTPQQGTLAQLAQILAQSTSGTRSDRQQAKQAMEEAQSHPDFNNYLAYLLVTPIDGVQTEVRAAAGLVLKNNLRRSGPESLDFIKQESVKGLVDPNHMIRNVSSIVVTTLLALVKVSGWPELLGLLVQLVESPDQNAQEGAMSALAKVCEDSASDLDTDYTGHGDRPSNVLIPKFIEFCRSNSPRMRADAVFCLTQFIPLQSQAFLAHMDEFLQAVFTLANDPNSDTRKNIAIAFKNLLEFRADKVMPHLDGVVDYCLHCVKDENEAVALEGAEFILALAESYIEPASIIPLLPRIIPVILTTMVYSDADMFVLDSLDDDDQNVQDRAEDIRPVHARSKDAHAAKSKNAGSGGAGGDDDDDDDEEDLEGSLENWNLRKCSAASLDVFAGKYPSQVLQIILPHLLERVNSSDWPVRESAVLAFGAIAQGCLASQNVDFVPELVPFLVKLLKDENAAVREMSCWALGRYGEPVVESDVAFAEVLQGLLACMLDKNKKVQEAGCGALSVVAELAGYGLMPYAQTLFFHFQQCFAKYQARNMLALFESIQSVVQAVAPAVAEPGNLTVLMDPIIKRWELFADSDRELLPLLECLAVIAASAGPAFAPYTETVFHRCIMIIRSTFVLAERYKLDPTSAEEPEFEFVVCALDLLDGLVQGLQDELEPLLASCQDPSFMELVFASTQCEMMEVRQSAFALIGDMAIFCPNQLRAVLPQLIPDLISHITLAQSPYTDPVTNNALWATGELAMRITGDDLRPYFQQLFQQLGVVLMGDAFYTVLENAAITIGRLGLSLSAEIAPHLRAFIAKWLQVIAEVDETNEKDTAFQGMCMIIGANPSALNDERVLVALFRAFAAYMDPSPPLKQLVAKVLTGYKSYLSNFNELVAKLGADQAVQLHATYGV